MPVFFGEMQHLNHPATMPATVHVDKGTIRLQSGRTELGEWKLYQVVIEERDATSVLFRADEEELILTLREHQSFLAETAPYRRGEGRARRVPTHEAFRKPDEGPTLGEEIKEDVSREVSSVADEVKELVSMLPSGPPLWIGIGVFLLAIIFIPSVVLGLLFAVGVAALVVGAIGYADSSVAVRLPGTLTPIRVVAIGVVCVLLGVVVAILR